MGIIGINIVLNDIGDEYKESDHDDGYVGSSMHEWIKNIVHVALEGGWSIAKVKGNH
jgi:hypothetical protein